LTSFIPAYISLFYYRNGLFVSLFIGLIFGLIGYLVCLIYFAKKIQLEVK
jgi:thiamine transporter ThiT